MKILFITANRVGDAVLTTGVLSWLVDQYPDAHFTIACGPYGSALFNAVPRLERLIVMQKRKWNGHWLDLWRDCFPTHWDLIVDLRNSIVSRLLRADKRVFHSRGTGAHKVIDNAAVLGLTPPPNPHIWISPEAEQRADLLLPVGRPVLALGPAANWPLKQWPVHYFLQLVEILTAPTGAMAGAAVLILADHHERDQIDLLLRSLPDTQRIEVIGNNLQLVAACLKRSRLYVGNDSGLMHLAAALGTPTLGLFGPGFPLVYGPWGSRCAYVTTTETREELMAKAPVPVTKESTLMASLTVTKVAEAAQTLLKRTA